MLLVGTMHGLVLVFSVKQRLESVLGISENGAEYGAVTSVDVNETDEVLSTCPLRFSLL